MKAVNVDAMRINKAIERLVEEGGQNVQNAREFWKATDCDTGIGIISRDIMQDTVDAFSVLRNSSRLSPDPLKSVLSLECSGDSVRLQSDDLNKVIGYELAGKEKPKPFAIADVPLEPPITFGQRLTQAVIYVKSIANPHKEIINGVAKF